MNLGAGLPANQIPAQVTAAYPADVNGGSEYTHEYTYPHPLVTGGPNSYAHPQPLAQRRRLRQQLRLHIRFIELAGEINTHVPERVVHAVADALNTQHKAIKRFQDFDSRPGL